MAKLIFQDSDGNQWWIDRLQDGHLSLMRLTPDLEVPESMVEGEDVSLFSDFLERQLLQMEVD